MSFEYFLNVHDLSDHTASFAQGGHRFSWHECIHLLQIPYIPFVKDERSKADSAWGNCFSVDSDVITI